MLKRRVVFVAAIAFAAVSVAVQGAPPNPFISGPIPATVAPGDPTHDYPFFSTTIDLGANGYVEQEFFFSGTANTYIVSDPLGTATIAPTAPIPYTTRMVVRRPASQDDFNGTVIIEWQNDTAGFNLDALWIQSSDHFLRRGYAWIGVAAQRAGVHAPVTGLKSWSPVRYNSLNVPSDNASYDIFSQAAQAVLHPQGIDPMGGLAVQRVFAVGASAAAVRLTTYHNSIHPLAGVLDGFGLFVSVSPTLLRTDQNVKVFKVLSETDVAGNAVNRSQVWFRQPDSDRLRRWEVAGSAHLDFYLSQGLGVLQTREGFTPLSGAACVYPAFSRIPLHFVANAVYDRMVEWVKDGVSPPSAPDIEIANLGTQVATLARDDFGNALGGVRLSQHAVATATNTGINLPDLPATNFCRTFGSYVPFDAATLVTLYRNHGSYVSGVVRMTEENLISGYIVAEDADATEVDAAHSNVGKP